MTRDEAQRRYWTFKKLTPVYPELIRNTEDTEIREGASIKKHEAHEGDIKLNEVFDYKMPFFMAFRIFKKRFSLCPLSPLWLTIGSFSAKTPEAQQLFTKPSVLNFMIVVVTIWTKKSLQLLIRIWKQGMMNIELRLYATLSKYLPEGTIDKCARIAVDEKTRVKDLLDRLGVPEKSVKLIFVNGVHSESDRVISDGDRIGVFPAVGGG